MSAKPEILVFTSHQGLNVGFKNLLKRNRLSVTETDIYSLTEALLEIKNNNNIACALVVENGFSLQDNENDSRWQIIGMINEASPSLPIVYCAAIYDKQFYTWAADKTKAIISASKNSYPDKEIITAIKNILSGKAAISSLPMQSEETKDETSLKGLSLRKLWQQLQDKKQIEHVMVESFNETIPEEESSSLVLSATVTETERQVEEEFSSERILAKQEEHTPSTPEIIAVSAEENEKRALPLHFALPSIPKITWPMFNRKAKQDQSREAAFIFPERITLGVFSLSRGSGATTTALDLAEYLRFKGKTALVAMDEKHDLDFAPVQSGIYVCVPHNTERSIVIPALSQTHPFIVIDFGTIFELAANGLPERYDLSQKQELITELLRCDKRVCLTFSAPWHIQKQKHLKTMRLERDLVLLTDSKRFSAAEIIAMIYPNIS